LMVNATAGTTVLGAIDDLEAVAEVCKKHGVWMHVDVSLTFMLFSCSEDSR
jgi:glutamate/tyrosine decarboxylase-like PLP-dependent enzyme